MTNDNREPQAPIRPATFSVSADTSADERGAARRTLKIVAVVSGLTLLVFALFVVVVVLPRWVEAPERAAHAPPASAARSAPVTPAADTESADETVDAGPPGQRGEVQALLRDTLEKFAVLESAGADAWAKPEVHAIRERIADGEKAYREKRYNAATNAYLDAASRIERTLAMLPARVESLLDAGALALDNGDSAAASDAFRQVLAIEPAHAGAEEGLARAGTLDQVFALVGQAEGYERLGQSDQAIAAYREALSLDPKTPGAAAAVRRLEQERRAAAFRKAMSDGLQALEAERFDDARKALDRALALDANAPEALAARRQLDNAETTWQIDRALAAAVAAERNESWSDAASHYERALKLDPRLTAAAQGKRRADGYHRLHTRLAAYLARPARLTSAGVRDEAEAAVAQARKIERLPSGIAAQVAALEAAVALARTPVTVALRSNAATEVTIYRIGELGTFEQREVSLLPGPYTAVGKRDGYRDVRVEFEVEPGDDSRLITIQCEEKFAFGS